MQCSSSNEFFVTPTSSSSQSSNESNPPSLLAAVLSTTSNVTTSNSCTPQICRSEAPQASSASQYEHVTVMTHLQQPPLSDARTQCAVRCPIDTPATSYTNNVRGVGSLHVHAPSAITQQVQLSVPAITASSICNPSFRVVTHRAPSYRGNSSRAHKTSLSTMLPMMGRGNAKQLANMTVIGDDGPTVRQHLQQQQQKAKLQQQLALQAKQSSQQQIITCEPQQSINKVAIEQSNDGMRAAASTSTVRDTVMSSVARTKTGALSSAIQRSYAPRLTSTERQRVAAEAVRQLQLQENHDSTQQRRQRGQSQPTVLSALNTSSSPSVSFQRSLQQTNLTTSQFIQNVQQQRIPLQVAQTEQRGSSLQQPTSMVDTQSTTTIISPARRTFIRKRSPRSLSQVHVTMLSAPHSQQPQQQNASNTAPQQVTVTENDRIFPFQSSDTSNAGGAPAEVSECGQVQENSALAPPPQEIRSHFVAQQQQQQATRTQEPQQHFVAQIQATCVNAELTAADQLQRQQKQVNTCAVNSTRRPPQKGTVLVSATVGAVSQPSNTIVTQRHGSSVLITHQKPVTSAHFVHPHSGNVCNQSVGSSGNSTSIRQRISRLPPHVLRQKQEEQMYLRKMYFLKRTIKALVFKNGALCDEVARLNQRIQTVTDERKQVFELSGEFVVCDEHFLKNLSQAAALAAKLSAFQSTPISVNVELESESLEARPDTNDLDDNENDSEKSAPSSSCSPSPITSNSASRVATPESIRQSESGMMLTTPATQNVSRRNRWKNRRMDRASSTRTCSTRKGKRSTPS
ncbi:unnamed protein product [Anisakis simplex]|uniref:Uncharacterized protein n=1 Tax=Anisakis simplex TaxID=6269 RepID=A0A0M3JRH7_ANISI|nr:unnamed protein product [Anisakis simplex]